MGERQRLGRFAMVALSSVAVLVGIWLGLRSPEPVPVVLETLGGSQRQIGTGERAVAPLRALVHVSGAVANPGLVVLAEGDRVADALARVGGVLAYADLSAINLADSVSDGQQIIVPGGAVGSGPEFSGGVVDVDDGLVHLNTATVEELEALPGVGEVLAKRIIARRESNGPFQTVEDLLDVSGIGERKLAGMRDVAAVP